MGKITSAILGVLLLSLAARAQQPPADPFETAWHVNVLGGYENLSNAETNSGFVSEVAVRAAKHWAGYLDYFQQARPGAKTVLAGPLYNVSLAHVLPESQFIDRSRLEVFVKLGLGASHVEPCPGGSPPHCVDLVNGRKPAFKFAFGVGGGLNYRISDKMVVRPFEVNFVHSAVGNQAIGNHLQFVTWLGWRF